MTRLDADRAGSSPPDGPASPQEQQRYDSYVRFCRMVGTSPQDYPTWRDTNAKLFGHAIVTLPGYLNE